jgi:adhesin transport system outer membrane protein
MSMGGLVPLSDVLKNVAVTNPEILESLKRYESIKAEMGAATSGYKPIVGVEASIGPETSRGENTEYDREDLMASKASIYARQNLFNGMNTRNYIKETQNRVKAAAYDVLNTANTVFLNTTEAYLEILKNVELVELARQNVLTQAQILKQIREKTDSGFGRASDLSNSESRFALARGNFISQQQDLNQAIVKFHRQFGRIVEPKDLIIPEPVYGMPDTKEEAIDIAMRTHPALQVANYNIEVKKYTYEKGKSAYWPTLDLELRADHSQDTDGDEGYNSDASAMLRLNYLLYDGGVRSSDKKRNYEAILTEYNRSYIERRNVNEIVGLAWNILDAEKAKKVFLAEHVDMSERTLVEFKEEYHLGRRTLLELMDIETEYFTAKNSFVESKYSYLTAYYRLSQALGLMLHEFETGIINKVGLQEEEAFNMEIYKKLGDDRDADVVKDVYDQCDNSMTGSDTIPWGCIGEEAFVVGYTLPDNIEPYIVPKEERVATEEVAVLAIDDTKKEQSFQLSIINFNFDSAELTETALITLKAISDQLKTLENFTLDIVGHTDTTGSSRYNLKLSSARANAVLEELARLGIDRNIMKAYGMGSAQPLVSNQTLEGRKKNRRIEFKLVRE